MIVCSFIIPASAQESEALLINFSEFKFETYDYNPDKVKVEYEQIGTEEKAYITDKSGNVLETLSVRSVGSRAANVYPYVIVRSSSYGGTTVAYNMNVELYSNGSFRSINSYQGGYLGITTRVTDTSLEGSNCNAWSPTGFPTLELYYAYNGTLVAEVTVGMSSSVSADLLGAGFTAGSTIDGKTYYRRGFNSTGIVKL